VGEMRDMRFQDNSFPQEERLTAPGSPHRAHRTGLTAPAHRTGSSYNEVQQLPRHKDSLDDLLPRDRSFHFFVS
jgi:hypothetical protein